MSGGLLDGPANFLFDEVAERLLVLTWMCFHERLHAGSKMVRDHYVCREFEVCDFIALSILGELDVSDQIVRQALLVD